MAFRFSLRSDLGVREAREQRERLRLAKWVQRIHGVRQQMDALEREKETIQENLERDLTEGLVGAEIQFQLAREAAITQHHAALAHQMSEFERERQTQERVFQQARRDRKILENLRNRLLDQYRQEEKRREQQQMDDLYLTCWPAGNYG